MVIAREQTRLFAICLSGLMLSRTILDWRPDVATLPVWLFLAALRERPFRPLTIG